MPRQHYSETKRNAEGGLLKLLPSILCKSRIDIPGFSLTEESGGEMRRKKKRICTSAFETLWLFSSMVLGMKKAPLAAVTDIIHHSRTFTAAVNNALRF